MFLQDNKSVLLITALTIIGLLLRFYNLDWGAPFYFHPDERNMSIAISQFSFPEQLHPHFFAYGSFPLYIVFFTGLLSNLLTFCISTLFSCFSTESILNLHQVSFEQAILLSRTFTASFSALLIPLMAYLGTKLYGRTAGILASALTTFSVGFIQFAHFGTTEMWLTFFSVILFLLLYRLQKEYSVYVIGTTGIVLGLLVATKISSLALSILPLFSLVISFIRYHRFSFFRLLLFTTINTAIIFCIAGIVFFLTNPFVFLDFPAFQGSMEYETAVARGTLPVFYTQEFIKTLPVIFQLLSVYPFLINPLLTTLLIPSLIIVLYRIIRYKDLSSLLVILFFLTIFLSQALLFVKWTRYMMPTLPFVYLIIIGASDTIVRQRFFFLRSKSFRYGTGTLVVCFCSIFAFSYTQTVYASKDSRIEAAEVAATKLSGNAAILSEVYDLGIIPFNEHFPSITLFNFYEVDSANPEATPEKLNELLQTTQYIILPSQRLYKTRILYPERYSVGGTFYTNLAEENGYRKIYETPCPLLCYLTYLGSPVFSYEATASVFDRPTVMIYEKL